MRLNQITIPSLDVEKSVAFYKKLGMHLIVDALPNYVRFEVPEGDATFSIHLVEKIQSGAGVVLYFEEAHLDAWVEELQGKGMVFTQQPTDQTWLWREAECEDPDGHRIKLYKAGVHRKNPPWRL